LGGGRVQTQGQIKQLKQAEELFLSVLTANPSLTGLITISAAFYFKEFDPTRAWLCFDAGRAPLSQPSALPGNHGLGAALCPGLPG